MMMKMTTMTPTMIDNLDDRQVDVDWLLTYNPVGYLIETQTVGTVSAGFGPQRKRGKISLNCCFLTNRLSFAMGLHLHL